MESWCTLGLSFCLTWGQITFGNVQVDTHHIRESSKVLFVVSSPERALNPMSTILNTVFWSISWWFEVISGAFPTRLEPHFGHLTGRGGFVHWMPPPIHHEGRLDTVCLEPSHINFGFLNTQSGEKSNCDKISHAIVLLFSLGAQKQCAKAFAVTVWKWEQYQEGKCWHFYTTPVTFNTHLWTYQVDARFTTDQGSRKVLATSSKFVSHVERMRFWSMRKCGLG